MIAAKRRLKAYLDLTRAKFWFCWPLLFCSTLLLAFKNYGGFSWSLVVRAGLLGLLALEAGFVLNDYVDRDTDEHDVEFDGLTRYWRPFNQRPIPSGQVSPASALRFFLVLVAVCVILIATLPFPNRAYLAALMILSYGLEYFYQVKKRTQRFPFAQLLGRMDFALFPAAGYLCYGRPDLTTLALFVFFYFWAVAHLAVNDLADVRNDEARGMKSVTVLYGMSGSRRWILAFCLAHLGVSPLLLANLGTLSILTFCVGFSLIGLANYRIMRNKDSTAGLNALPYFHWAMAAYVIGLFLDYLIRGDLFV